MTVPRHWQSLSRERYEVTRPEMCQSSAYKVRCSLDQSLSNLAESSVQLAAQHRGEGSKQERRGRRVPPGAPIWGLHRGQH